MKILIGMFFLGLFSTAATAQIYGPFPSGAGVEEKSSTIRCMPNKLFADMIKEKGLHLMAMQVAKENDKAIKIISNNLSGDVVVANIMPDQTVCVLDILTGALMSKDMEKEPSPPPEQQQQ